MNHVAKRNMTKVRINRRFFIQHLLFLLSFLAWNTGIALADPLSATREVIFTGEGAELTQMAADLNSPAAIYEYIRNTHEYALYHGSRSNSINTYGGRRGSDVDIASVLIAMYRSQNIPARYAVGTVRVPALDVANWLGVKNIDLATAIMNDQGIQHVSLSQDRQFIEFEHVWVQAQVPYDNYRGATASTTSCSATPARCNWIDLDPSYKLRTYHNQNIDVYSAVQFDYNRYYNAIKNNDPAYRDKNPLAIYQEQALVWLQANHPGKTLEDVADPGVIIEVRDGILPASLPYQIISQVRTYDSIAEHDVVEERNWAKYLTGQFHIKAVMSGGSTISITTGIGGPHALADLSTKRLTVTYSPLSVNGVADRVEVRLDGTVVATPFQSSGNLTFPLWTPFSVDISLDGAPGTASGEADHKINVTYNNMIVGGYYLIGTGGDTSNWSQVHRAAAQLLAANETYKIINDTNGVPYVDKNGNGVVDASDTLLLNTPDAQDALTGGLLYVAMSQYYTKFVENIRQLDGLNHVISPIEGFVGVVSSTYEVDYLGDTAFSVMPGGLLIDMKGVQFNGQWRTNAASEFANAHFELMGHEGSSLEHEIWQALTGFDAVSTVRGIQMALANGEQLLELMDGSETTINGMYDSFGLTGSAPSSFDINVRDVFSSRPTTWSHATTTAEERFDVLKKFPSNNTELHAARLTYYNDYWHSNVGCFDTQEQAIRNLISQYGGSATLNAGTVCGYSFSSGTTLNQLLSGFEYYFKSYFGVGNAGKYDFLDQNLGFSTSNFVFRNGSATDIHTIDLIQNIRNNLIFTGTVGDDPARWEYVIPSRKVTTGYNIFSVYMQKIYNGTTNNLASQSYSISNDSFTAGGGWVDGTQALEAATAIPGTSVVQPTFNNELFTDKNLVAQTNNDLIRTPSTADPVSTVTGNMYHDETDLTIRGRGLHYTLTRSYNSSPARSGQDGPFGYGWTHSYNMQLRSNDYGVCPNCTQAQAAENGNNATSSITYIDERGGEHTYLLNADGSGTRSVAENPPGEYETLQLNTPASGQFILTFRNGVKYVFSGAATLANTPNQYARLASIEDPYSNRLTMGYDANDRLITIQDNLNISGRTGVTITYHGTTGHIATISDWTGRQWQYGYDGSGNLTTVTNPLANSITYTYHPESHLLNELRLPADRGGQQAKTAFSYYRNNKAFNYANALGEAETLDYDLYRQTTRVTDPRGFVREHFYDRDNGALVKLKEPDGAILQFANNDDGLRYSKTDGLSYTTRYSYQADRSVSDAASTSNGLVSREIDPLNQQADYNYGLYDQPTATTDKRGHLFTRVYAQTTNGGTGAIKGKLTQIRATVNGQDNVLLESYKYYAISGLANYGQLWEKSEFIDPADSTWRRVTGYTYEANGINLQRMTVTDTKYGAQIVKTFTYDDLGRLLTETLSRSTSATDPTIINLTTTYAYDTLDRVVRVIDPRGDIRETVYDGNGKVTEEKVHHKQADGSFVVRTVATHAYDAADRRISTTDVLGNVTRFEYDEAGNLIAQTDANGHTTNYEYDAMNRHTAVIDANGHRSSMRYDLAGRLIETTDANGNSTRFEYDALGRQTKAITALGFESRSQYDANGNVTHVTDANGVAGLQPVNNQNASLYREYDELNRLTLERDALGGDTRYAYDLLGNITRITDAKGQVTEFNYNGLGWLIETVDPVRESPDKIDRVLLYDQAGNVLLTEDRSGRQRRHTYDLLNRRILTEYLADGSSDRLIYDGFGDLVEASNDQVIYTYTYTPRHELASKTDSGLGKRLSWTYDAVGNVATKTDYQNEVTEYQYDSTNRLVAQRNPGYLQVSYHYDGAGRLIDRILSNGVQTTYRYDADNRLVGLKNLSASGTVVEDLSYQRDNLGNITRITHGTSGKIVDYTYDPLYRLTAVDSTDNTEDQNYTYDQVGNRLTQTENGVTTHYGYGTGNRLLTIRSGSASGPLHRQFTYDDAGRLLAKRDGSGNPIYTVTYNGKGRAGEITALDGQHVFSYDTNDYRIEKDGELYHLEGEHLESVYSPGGVLREKYLRGVVVDEIVNGYRYPTSNPNDKINYSFHHDHLNSVTAVTGHEGSIKETWEYDAFGNPLTVTIPGTGNTLLYTGREYDKANGLYYYRARYYDPEIGRFLSEDPKGFAAGVNFYAYVGNNPVNGNDPSGKIALIDNAIGGLIAGGVDLAAQYAQAKFSGESFKINWTRTGVALGAGFVTSGASSLFSEGVASLGIGSASSFALRTAGNSAIGASANVGQTATLNYLQGTNDSLSTAALWGGGFGGLGSVVADAIPAVSSAMNKTRLNEFGAGEYNFWANFAESNGLKLGGPSHMATVVGTQFGNAVSSFTAFNPGDSGTSNATSAGGGFVIYPNKPNSNMMKSVYSK